MGIVVLGAVFVDIKGHPYGQYIPNGRNSGEVEEVHGGVSRNICEDIANVELRPTFISVVDHSDLSDGVLKKLDRHKVNTKYIRRTDHGLGTWLAIFNNEGDVEASISDRPDLSEIYNILKEQGDEIFSKADSIVVDIDMEDNILNKVFELADKYGKTVYAAVSNMSIAMERRDLIKRTGCLVCNEEEAGLLFSDDYSNIAPDILSSVILRKIRSARIKAMVVTLGPRGSVYAKANGEHGVCPAINTPVVDTAGCGDAFFAGVTIGLTYGKTLQQSCAIGTRLASAVIATTENVCPRFMPQEFGLCIKK